jgi:hypothetical protein
MSWVSRWVKDSKARRIQVVRAISANVPIWGKPLGPKPVSNRTGIFSDFENRLRNLSASLKGQDL